MNIIKKIKDLHFSEGSYIVVGSGILEAKGIRETHDVDIVVSPDLFEKCKSDNWEQVPWAYEKIGQVFLRKGEYELYLDVNCGDFNPSFEELLKRVEIIDGVSFVSLGDTIKFKKAYNKPKHLKDIELIDNYLKQQSSQNE